jgi:hypothetical protein
MSKTEIKVSFKPYDLYSKNSIASIGMKQGLDLTLSVCFPFSAKANILIVTFLLL